MRPNSTRAGALRGVPTLVAMRTKEQIPKCCPPAEGVSGRPGPSAGSGTLAGAAGRGIPPPPSEKAASFFHQYRDVVLVEVRAEGLPVARFQRLSEGAVFPEQDHAAVQAIHVELAVGVDAFRPERGP